ncbi:hypothetical protein XENOCAPTIV_012826, partial [Xenoophorus captivus]
RVSPSRFHYLWNNRKGLLKSIQFSQSCHFFDDIVEGAFKPQKSKGQRRREKIAGTVRNTAKFPVLESDETEQSDFLQLQKKDVTLKDCYKRAVEIHPDQDIDVGYFLKEKVFVPQIKLR